MEVTNNQKREIKMENTANKIEDFLTVRTAAKEFPFSESAIRHMIFLNKEGFKDKVVIKIGKKILLKRKEIISFLYDNSLGGNHA
ncbi:MAG: hypothetical protein KR126chlam5_00050 [Candidatus Anoxychlamydiales bacterium]|nr:hypothetical protein [Candidatus Anoxychlamydiales bacterium]